MSDTTNIYGANIPEALAKASLEVMKMPCVNESLRLAAV